MTDRDTAYANRDDCRYLLTTKAHLSYKQRQVILLALLQIAYSDHFRQSLNGGYSLDAAAWEEIATCFFDDTGMYTLNLKEPVPPFLTIRFGGHSQICC